MTATAIDYQPHLPNEDELTTVIYIGNKRTKMLILKQGSSSVVMPVCYHPTTVLVVDDDVDFLNKLKASVAKNIALICFDNPDAVIDYIKNSRELQIPLASRLHFTGEEDTQGCGFAKMLDGRLQDIIHPYCHFRKSTSIFKRSLQ